MSRVAAGAGTRMPRLPDVLTQRGDLAILIALVAAVVLASTWLSMRLGDAPSVKIAALLGAPAVIVIAFRHLRVALAILAFALAVPLRADVPGIGEVTTTQVLLGVVVLRFAMLAGSGRIRVPRALMTASILLLAGGTVAALAGPHRSDALVLVATALLPAVMAGWAVAASLRPERDLGLLTIALSAGLAVSGLAALLQYAGGSLPGTSQVVGGRANGFLAHPNILGGFCAATVLVLLGVASQAWRRFRLASVVLALPIVLGLTGLVLTLSRGALLGFAAGLVVVLVLLLARRQAQAVGALVLAVALVVTAGAVIVPPTEREVLEQRFSDLGVSPLEGRPLIHRVAQDTIGDNVLTGIGPLEFGTVIERSAASPLFAGGALHAHSLPLEGYLSVGPVGLAALVALLVAAAARLRTAVWTLRRNGDRLADGWALGILGALTALLVQGAAEFVFWQLEMLVLAFVLLGGAFALGAVPAAGRSRRPSATPRRRAGRDGGPPGPSTASRPPARSAARRSCAVAALATVAGLALPGAAAPASAETLRFAAQRSQGNVLVFRIRGVRPARIRAAWLRAEGRRRRPLRLATARRAAARGVLRVRRRRGERRVRLFLRTVGAATGKQVGPPGMQADPATGLQAATERGMQVGLNAQTAGWGPDIGVEQQRAAQSGVRTLREEFTWSRIEPSDDAFNWGLYDTVVGEAARLGITVLPLLLGTPAWAGATWNTLPDDPAEFAQFAAQVSGRYGPGGSFWAKHPALPAHPIAALELWNEPYLLAFSAGGPDPTRYAELVTAAARASRRANSGVRILAAVDLHDESGGDWIGELFRARPELPGLVDGLAVHPYSRGSPDHFTPPAIDFQFRRLEVIRQHLVLHGEWDPLWITEIGWSTCPGGAAGDCVTEQAQADHLSRAIELARGYGYVHASYVYAFRDWEGVPANRERWFGIVRLDGTPKPAWPVVRNAAERAGL